MVDVVDPATRSRMMSGIRGKNTKPERLVRKYLHASGLRFRLHVKTLPGKPDLVFPKFRTVVFVHGCFWHGHDCHLFKWPASNREFWVEKIGGNQRRFASQKELLELQRWRVLEVYECVIKNQPIDKIELVMQHLVSQIKNG